MATKELSQVSIATELYQVQQEMTELKEREDELRGVLLESMQKQGVGFVRLDNGTSFTRAHRESLKIKDTQKATAWAEKHDCLKVDTTKAFKILRRELKPLPKFFERVVGDDYLTIKRTGDTQDDE